MRIVQSIRGLVYIIFLGLCHTSFSQNIDRTKEIIDTLSSDILMGRLAGTDGERITTDYISNEFEKLGLTPAGEDGTFFQVITKYQKNVQKNTLIINKEHLGGDQFFVDTNTEAIFAKKVKVLKVVEIPEDNSLMEFRKELITQTALTFVWVTTEEHKKELELLRFKSNQQKYFENIDSKQSIVWVIPTPSVSTKFKKVLLDFKQEVNAVEMRNVMAKLEGTSKKDEIVMFGAHHDHLGVLDPIQGDSIANGADDNASGVSGVIQIAEYFAKKKRKYPRTLLFTTFTAEELGLVGSQYMASKMTDQELNNIVAFINIEMIGKPSSNGKRKVFVTGYQKSNLGRLMQGNIKKARMKFQFFADPYPDLKLFMRSDNASFAAKGVPAHTFSSTDIDFDSYYHTVNDEPSTLDYVNIVEVIKGIIKGVEPIVMNRMTPTRIR